MAQQRRALLLALLAGIALPAAVENLALPGDPNYCVTLEGIRPSHGVLQPAYSPDATDFTVMVEDRKATSLTISLDLDLYKYRTDTVPDVFVDGKKLAYLPTEPVAVQVDLDESIGPFDRTYHFRVADPSGGHGFLIFKRPTERHYSVRVRQPARYRQAVQLDSLSVTTSSGAELKPAGGFFRDVDSFVFHVPPQDRFVKISAKCQLADTEQLLDGQPVEQGKPSVFRLTDRVNHVNLVCIYREKVFKPVVEEHVYSLKFTQHLAISFDELELALRIEPRHGYCAARGTIEEPKFECYTHVQQTTFVATYEHPRAKVVLTNPRGKGYHLANGILQDVPVGSKKEQWKIVVSGGGAPAEAPVEMISAAACASLRCPSGTVHRQAHEQVQLCFDTRCTEKDANHCCESLPTCGDFHSCSVIGRVVAHDNFCATLDCKDDDANRMACCKEPDVEDELRTLFGLLDADGTGQISPAELRRGAKAIGRAWPLDRAQKALHGAKHVGHVGAVTWKEFKSAAHDPDGSLFPLMDFDGDGLLQPADLVAGATQVRVQDGLALVFSGIDKDGDGKISHKELHRAAGRFHDNVTAQQERDAIIELDFNTRDGEIDLQEFLMVNDRNIHDPLIVKLLDRDGNGLLTISDIGEDEVDLERGSERFVVNMMMSLRKRSEHWKNVGCSPWVGEDWQGQAIFYDESCSLTPPRLSGLGCFADGTNRNCRFCGFHGYPHCPRLPFHCFQPGCKSWSEKKLHWCKESFGFECPKFELKASDFAHLQVPEMHFSQQFQLEESPVEAAPPPMSARFPGVVAAVAVLGAVLSVVAFMAAHRGRRKARDQLLPTAGAEAALE